MVALALGKSSASLGLGKLSGGASHADTDPSQRLGSPEEAPPVDSDGDGVSDETEAWLGTSSFTDESGVDGRTDAGAVASTVRLHEAEERGTSRPLDLSAPLHEQVPQRASGVLNAEASFQGSSVAMRCLALQRF